MKARTSGKSRLFIVFTALLLLVIFALFHSSQQQVDELRVAGLKCEQHEMALRSQFDTQVETMSQLEAKLRAEKELRAKAVKDANARFSSLQNHYKALQSDHEEIKTKYAASKKLQHDQINRIRTLTDELADGKRDWAASIEQWKTKYTRLEVAMNRSSSGHLESLRNQQLTDELTVMRDHCAFRLDKGSSPTPLGAIKSPEVQRSFDEQVLVSENTYQIPIHIQTPGLRAHNTLFSLSLQTSNRTMDLHRNAQLPYSSTVAEGGDVAKLGGIINSVENFQILPKPLEAQAAEPPHEGERSSTATVDKHRAQKQPEQEPLPIAIIQEQSSSMSPKHSIAVSPAASTPAKARKIPDGVVPIPESMNILLHNKEPGLPAGGIKNSRYNNVDIQNAHDSAVVDEQNRPNFLLNSNENVAHEVNDDFNIVEDRNHHDHHLEVGDKNVINNNAAEMDVHPEEDDEGVAGEKDKRNELDLGSINRGAHGADGMAQKRRNEDFVADQGFDDHMEEHVEEEDDDEYPNLAAQHEEGPAVRN